MPRRPKKPCAFLGCPNLTESRYCDEHTKVMNDRYNKYERPYDSSVRYGNAWRHIRNRYIKVNVSTDEISKDYPSAEINPIGDWTGGTDVDTGATNRKLGSDMADSVTGGGLHGKDLSKADAFWTFA